MSSPMMNRMLGFLPPAAGCFWAAAVLAWATRMFFSLPSVQHSAGSAARAAAACVLPAAGAPVWAATDDQCHSVWPVATPYPSSAPAATKIRAWSLGFLNIGPPRLKNRERLGFLWSVLHESAPTTR